MQRDVQDMADPAGKRVKDEALDLLRQILSEVIRTPEFKRARDGLIQRALSYWTAENPLARPEEGRMTEGAGPEGEAGESATRTNLAELAVWGNLGRLLTLGARYLAEKDKTEPDRWARLLEKPLKDILMNTDFGYLYEMVSASEGRTLATQEMIQTVMSEFPTKSGILPALRFRKTNTAMKKRERALKSMENYTPEMLVSSMVNLFNELIEPEALGALVQAAAEWVRRIHVGSAILGEAETPMIEGALRNKLRDAWAHVDPILFGKALVALAEEAEGISSAILTATADEPELLRAIVTSYGARKNPKIRQTRKKAELLEELVASGNGSEHIEAGLADLNTQELGDTLNAWLRMINQMHDARPEAVLTPLASLASMIDWDELRTASEWIMPDMIESIRPIAGAVMPSLLHGLCDLVTPSAGEETEALDEALARLRSLLSAQGGETS